MINEPAFESLLANYRQRQRAVLTTNSPQGPDEGISGSKNGLFKPWS
jgi:hypothetical protein